MGNVNTDFNSIKTYPFIQDGDAIQDILNRFNSGAQLDGNAIQDKTIGESKLSNDFIRKIEDADSSIRHDLNEETTFRTGQCMQLDAEIKQETQSRMSADEELSARLDTEAESRQTADDTKADKETLNGGFAGGRSAGTSDGGAIGINASTAGGAAVGKNAKSREGGAALGANASAVNGGAVGTGAQATDGFSGGRGAISAVDAIQLGTGTNTKEKTLQVYDYTLMEKDGAIPAERIRNESVATEKLARGAVTEAKMDSDLMRLIDDSGVGIDVNCGNSDFCRYFYLNRVYLIRVLPNIDYPAGTEWFSDELVTLWSEFSNSYINTTGVSVRSGHTYLFVKRKDVARDEDDTLTWHDGEIEVYEIPKTMPPTDGSVTSEKLAEELKNKLSSMVDRVFVDALPTEGISYDFAEDNPAIDPFIDAGHCQNSSAADGYLTIRSDERAAQIRKARAIYRFLTPDMLSAGDDATIVLEFDTRVPADTRWHIALVNLEQRGGDTYSNQYTDYDPGADNYKNIGLGFWHGVANSTGLYQINGRNSGYNRNGEAIGDMSDVWIHTRVELPLNKTWITWTLTNRDTGEQIDTGSYDYQMVFDTDCGIINGIELHTWTTTSIDIDNISVKAVNGISPNRIFTVRNTGTSYIYNGTTPKAITA